MDKRTRKQIEWAFYNYEANKNLGAELVEEIAERGLTADLDKIGFGGGISNPTESKALLLADKLRPYLWAKVVENTLRTFRFEPEYDLMTALYIDGKKPREIFGCGFISEPTFWRTRERWLEVAFDWAKTYGIL